MINRPAKAAHIEFFPRLPDEQQIQIMQFLNYRDAASFNQATAMRLFPTRSHPLMPGVQDFIDFQFFKMPKAVRRFRAVENADYVQVEHELRAQPAFIFEAVNYIFRNGEQDRISPLEFVCRVGDIYMFDLFYAAIKNKPEWLAEFLQKAREQAGRHWNLEKLIRIYEQQEEQLMRHHQMKLPKVTGDALAQGWVLLGQAQRKYLPMYLLKLMTQKHFLWIPNQPFVTRGKPRPDHCRVYDMRTNTTKDLAAIVADPAWGTSLTLFRGTTGDLCASSNPYWLCAGGHDLRTLLRAYQDGTEALLQRIEAIPREVSAPKAAAHQPLCPLPSWWTGR